MGIFINCRIAQWPPYGIQLFNEQKKNIYVASCLDHVRELIDQTSILNFANIQKRSISKRSIFQILF